MAKRARRRTSVPSNLELRPGLGAAVLAEIAPLLADEGIDLDNLERCDPQRLQEALNRAAERINLARFTPVGEARSLAASRLREAVDAFAAGENEAGRRVLARLPAEAGDGAEPTVSACIGVSLGLLDDWLSTMPGTAADLPDAHGLPSAGDDAERAAVQIVALARRGEALATLEYLVSEHGGKTLLFGCVMALNAVARAWSAESDQSVARVLFDRLR
jgi:hypothetical protein